MKVAVVGAAGQLGSDLVAAAAAAGHEVAALDHSAVEVTDEASVRSALTEARPDVVFNCAAFHRVDDCEIEIARTLEVNVAGAAFVAGVCEELGAAVVQISSDYVFDGEKGAEYVESDDTGPVNIYGASKVASEAVVRQRCSRWTVARVASLFGVAGASGKGGNFIEAILKKARAGDALTVVDDTIMSPTYTADAAVALVALATEGVRGVVHVTNEGSCSWYEFAVEALKTVDLDATVTPVSSTEYPTRAKRPRNSSLRSERPDGPRLRRWRDALAHYLVEKGHVA